MNTSFTLHGSKTAPAIILIHGLGLTRATWDGHISALSQNHLVVAYDLLGHGQSAAPQRKPDLMLYSQQLAALMDELAIPSAHILGFSLGGMINRRFVMDYPDRVKSLCILNSPHERAPDAQKLVEERAAASDAGGPGANLEVTLSRWFTPEFRREHPETVQNVANWVLANDPKTYADCRYVLAHGVKELIRPNPPLDKPTLVITCEHDTGSTPQMSRAIASEISGAECLIVPHLQHLGLMEQPELFTTPILSFLEQHP